MMGNWLRFIFTAPLSAVWHRLVACRRTIWLMERRFARALAGIRSSWECDCGAVFPWK